MIPLHIVHFFVSIEMFVNFIMREGSAGSDQNVFSLLNRFQFKPFSSRWGWDVEFIEAFLQLGNLSRAISCRLNFNLCVDIEPVVLALDSWVLSGFRLFVNQGCICKLTFQFSTELIGGFPSWVDSG